LGSAGGDSDSLYFSNIQFLGAFEPMTRMPGLALAAKHIFYNGSQTSFFQALANFKDNPDYHNYKAVYMESESVIFFEEQSWRIEGTGHIAIIQSRDNKVKIDQFAPGERVNFDDDSMTPF
jgi:hypothetical protein